MRLSTLLLTMLFVATSIALAGVVGVFLAGYMLALVGSIRSAYSGKRGGPWPLALLLIASTCACLLPALPLSTHESARRAQCGNNMRLIRVALLNYRDAHGTFPPPYVPDKDGKPMHSWRVLILPFIEQTHLYKQYNFNEPWDGPNNRKLASLRPPVYTCPSDGSVWAQGSTATSYVAVVGPKTVWADEVRTKEAPKTKPAKGPNPADTRLVVVEVADSGFHWMEPRDLTVEQAKAGINTNPGSGFSSKHPAGANALFADDRVSYLRQGIPSDLLETMLTQGMDDTTVANINKIEWESGEKGIPLLDWLRLFAWLGPVLVLLADGLIFDFRQRRAARRALECGNSLPLSDRAASP